jgi:hypothetical protein
VIVSSVVVTQAADRLFISRLTAAGVSPEVVTSIATTLKDSTARMISTVYPNLPDAVTKLTGVSYAEAYTSGMTQMFFAVAIGMFLTALVLYIGMRRGLRASMAVPLSESDASATSSHKT